MEPRVLGICSCRHYLSGPRKGVTEEFSPTPGLPDNIRPNGRGGFLVGVPIHLPAEESNPIWDGILRYPKICRFLARVTLGLRRAFTFLRQVVPGGDGSAASEWMARAAHKVTNPGDGLVGGHSFLLEFSREGKVCM